MANQKKKTKKRRPVSTQSSSGTKRPPQPKELTLASALLKEQKFTDAKAILNTFLQNNPHHARALAILGYVHNKQGDNHAATLCLQKATSLSPNSPDMLFNLGVFLQASDRVDEALAAYRKVLQLQPDNTNALHNVAVLLHTLGDLSSATEIFTKIITIAPDSGNAFLNLGEIYRNQGKFEAAVEHYQKGLHLIPDSRDDHNNLGTIYKITHQLTLAIEAFQKAIQIDPSYGALYCNIGSALTAQGRIEEALEYLQKALSIDNTLDMAAQNFLMALNYSTQLSPEEIFAKHREWGQQIEQRVQQQRTRLPLHPIGQDRRIRIGYLSADFGKHAVANFIEPILATHHRNDFEIICYADVQYPDERTDRLKNLTDQWRDIFGSDDETVAPQILADGIDILVDLAGHTANNRLSLFARKPAPIQVTYLGYPNTTGLSTMDYRLTDDLADPAGQTEHLHTETLLRLPDSFLCYGPPLEDFLINEPPVLKNGYTTFASFNNRPKINDTVIACWAKILNHVPNSRMLLKSTAFRDEPTRTRLLAKFAQEGIEPTRLDIREPVPNQAAHMQLYNLADIALDTFPYNGTTTTFEALWMGVPVITMAGKTHASRVGTSILNQIGSQDCIADNPDEYINLATTLAGDTERLTKLRKELRQRLQASPACDSRQFTHNLENAYRTMAEDWNKKIGRSTRGLENAANGSQDNQETAIQLNQFGEQLFGDNKIAEATQAFEEAIDLAPDLDVAHNNLGVVHWQQGHIQEAIACFQKALQINPLSLDAIDNLSAVLANSPTQQVQAPEPKRKTISISTSSPKVQGTQPSSHGKGSRTIWLASYPKSGNTFLRMLLHNYMYGEAQDSNVVGERFPDIHQILSQPAASCKADMTAQKIIKTHFCFNETHPYADTTVGFIYILRNPRDVLLSNARYLGTSGNPEQLRKFAVDFINAMGVPRWKDMGMGNWPEHLASWLQTANNTPGIFIKYEELRTDTANTLKQIVNFLGITPDDEKIAEAVLSCTLSKMRQDEIKEKQHGRAGVYNRLPNNQPFVGEGKTGQSLAGIGKGIEELYRERFGRFVNLFGYR